MLIPAHLYKQFHFQIFGKHWKLGNMSYSRLEIISRNRNPESSMDRYKSIMSLRERREAETHIRLYSQFYGKFF